MLKSVTPLFFNIARFRGLLVVTTLLILIASFQVRAEKGFEVSLVSQSPAPPASVDTAPALAFSTGNEVTFDFVFTNWTDETQSVLKWSTPLDGFRSRMFIVKRS